MIQINDQIIEVDGRSLYGYNNLQAVDLLRNTGRIVKLKLARYVKGSKYHDQIQKGVMNAEQQLQATATTTVRTNNGPTVIQINSQPSINTSNLMTSGPSSLAHRSPNDLREKWSTIVGPDFDIIVSKSSILYSEKNFIHFCFFFRFLFIHSFILDCKRYKILS